ncbi:hypothetical protein DFH27DRAFT_563501 [Peziza echinospora]|nr:hypothetical protein DFH27DRAFT_563501 [Peziza echinospora]
MHISPLKLATVATLSAAALGNALLIPDGIVGEWEKAVEEYEKLSATLYSSGDSHHRVVKSDCFGCFKDGGDGALVYDIVATDLGRPRLLINGGEFTPFNLFTNDFSHIEGLFPAVVKIPLVKPSETIESLTRTLDLSGSEVDVSYNIVSDQEVVGGTEVIRITFEPTTVDGRWVALGQSMGVEITLVREVESGKIEIVDVSDLGSGEMEGPIFIEFEEVEGCEGYLCGLFEKVTSWGRVAGEKVGGWGKELKEKIAHCGGAHGGEMEEGMDGGMVFEIDVDMGENEGSEVEDITAGTVPGADATEPQDVDEGDMPIILWEDFKMRPDHDRHGRPHAGHPHHHHHGHTNSHGMDFDDMEDDEGITLYKIFVHVLTPIAIGVGAGFLFSMIGMLIGHVVVMAWHKVRGTKMEGCYKRRAAREVGGGVDGEEAEKGLLEEEVEEVEEYTDAPPEYVGGVETTVGQKQ